MVFKGLRIRMRTYSKTPKSTPKVVVTNASSSMEAPGYVLFPVSSWKKNRRQQRSCCEQKTLKSPAPSIQSSNLKKSRLTSWSFRITNWPEVKWVQQSPGSLKHSSISLEDKHQVLQCGLHPAQVDTLETGQDLYYLLGVFHLKNCLSHSSLREDHPCLRIRFQIRQLTLIAGSTSIFTRSIQNPFFLF